MAQSCAVEDAAAAAGSADKANAVEGVISDKQDKGELKSRPSGHSRASNPELVYETADWYEVFAWYVYDLANSPFFQVVDVVMKVLLKRLAEFAAAAGNFPTHLMTAGSYPAMIMWCTAAAQAVSLLSFASLGDFGNKRFQLMKLLTFVGSGIVILVIFCWNANLWWFAGVLRVLAGICHIMSTVYYSSYLPLLAAGHYLMEGLEGAARSKREVELADEMSAKGFGLGYFGGILMQGIVFLILYLFEDPNGSEFQRLFVMSVSIAIVGFWWSGFSLYTFRHLKVRPGQPFPAGVNVICHGWRSTCQTLYLMLLTYHDALLFVISYFLWSDALATLLNVAILILDDTNEKGSSMMFSAILGTLAGLVGVFFFMKVQQCFHISNKAMLMAQLSVASVVSLAAGFGLVQAFGGFGFYMVLGPIMLMAGTLQANARSLYATLLIPGREVAMFSFYTILDKGSSLIGALVIGVVHTNTGSYYGVFWYTMTTFILAVATLYFLDVKRGMQMAGKSEATEGEWSL